MELLGIELVGFGLDRIVWSGGSRVWIDWNCLEWRTSVVDGLEWLGMEKEGFRLTGRTWNGLGRFGLTGIVLKGGSLFWIDWNCLDSRKSVSD
jgi:hypothetical protein